MSCGAFILLKVDCCRGKSAKQPKIRIATLLKILRISLGWPRNRWKNTVWLQKVQLFSGYGQSVENRPPCYSDHSFRPEIGALSPWRYGV